MRRGTEEVNAEGAEVRRTESAGLTQRAQRWTGFRQLAAASLRSLRQLCGFRASHLCALCVNLFSPSLTVGLRTRRGPQHIRHRIASNLTAERFSEQRPRSPPRRRPHSAGAARFAYPYSWQLSSIDLATVGRWVTRAWMDARRPGVRYSELRGPDAFDTSLHRH